MKTKEIAKTLNIELNKFIYTGIWRGRDWFDISMTGEIIPFSSKELLKHNEFGKLLNDGKFGLKVMDSAKISIFAEYIEPISKETMKIFYKTINLKGEDCTKAILGIGE